MPHKHRRQHHDTTHDSFELPPHTIAKPLPVFQTSKPTTSSSKASKVLKRRHGSSSRDSTIDDTPRAFRRLLAFQSGKRLRSGLDDGQPPPKRTRTASKTKGRTPYAEHATAAPLSASSATKALAIQPGERFADFAQRVDAALPVSGLKTKGKGAGTRGVPAHSSARQRRLHRMYAEWRQAESKRREQVEAAKDEREAMEDEELAAGGGSKAWRDGSRKRGGKAHDDEGDLWVGVGKKEEEMTKSRKGLVGLHDVVLAPPKFARAPKDKFRVRNGAKVDLVNVPAAAGSLRRREELSAARRSVVEGYRDMMRAKRGLSDT